MAESSVIFVFVFQKKSFYNQNILEKKNEA